MRAEGKAFCSDNWYLLAGVLLQKCSTNQPCKRQASMQLEPENDSHLKSSSNGEPSQPSTPDLFSGVLQGHGTDEQSVNGHSSSHHSSNGGHSVSSGISESDLEVQVHDDDLSGLRHRYSTDADGAVNTAEDQLDELIQVMTALR